MAAAEESAPSLLTKRERALVRRIIFRELKVQGYRKAEGATE